MAVKNTTPTDTTVQNEFSKEQLIFAERYAGRRDLLNALLEDNKTYTVEQVDALIESYYKKPI